MVVTTNGQTIPCPVCKTGVPFDLQRLLQGAEFACPNCGAGIGLADESKPAVLSALEALEKVKSSIAAMKPGTTPT